MFDIAEQVRDRIPRDYFSYSEVQNLIPGSDDRRYSLLKRAMERGDIIQIRRGFYCLAPRHRRRPLNLYGIAQRVYGPSYITAESALSYHGWIMEAVHAVTSATSRRSHDFKTPVGLFAYRHLLCDPLLVGVGRLSADGESFLMASPWKAIADYIFIYKKDWKGRAPLLNSLRMEEEALKSVNERELREISMAYRSRRVKNFLRTVCREI